MREIIIIIAVAIDYVILKMEDKNSRVADEMAIREFFTGKWCCVIHGNPSVLGSDCICGYTFL